MADLNAQQMAALDEKIRAHLSSAIEQMTIRKWAMEAALGMESADHIEMATKIYDFVVKPALEPFKPD